MVSCMLLYENLLAVLDKMEPISDLRDYQKFIDKSLNAPNCYENIENILLP